MHADNLPFAVKKKTVQVESSSVHRRKLLDFPRTSMNIIISSGGKYGVEN